MSKMHDGTCAFCGFQVRKDFVTCTGCGATWTPTVGLMGQGLFALAMPCGWAAAFAVGIPTGSLGMGLGAMFVAGIAVAGVARSSPFRRWLWVRR